MKTSASTWGGRREGAGRPKSSELVSHLKRPAIERKRSPALITLKIRSGFPSLRTPEVFEAFQKAAMRARRFGIRILEFSVRDRRILLVVEAKQQEELEKSFKSMNTTLAISLKKAFAKEMGRKHDGPVFLGRYEIEVLRMPEEVKLALRKVLAPEERDFSSETITPSTDRFSSGPLFTKWRALLGREFEESLIKASLDPSLLETKARITRITATPQFWLSQAGWLKG